MRELAAGPVGRARPVEIDPRAGDLGTDGVGEPVRRVVALHRVDHGREADHRGHGTAQPPGPRPARAQRRDDERALERREVGRIERHRLAEPRPAPRRVGAPAQPVPLGAGLREALAAHAVLGVGVEPAAQRAPAAHQHLVRELVGRTGLAVVRHHQPAGDQGGHRALGPVADRELGLGARHAGTERRHQPEQHAPRVHAIGRRHPGDHRVAVARQRPRDAAHRIERRLRDQPALAIARLPQLGERERQQRQSTAAGLGGRVDQLADHLVGLEADVGRRRGSGDHVADPLGRQRPHEVQHARQLLAEPRQGDQLRQEVGAHRRDQPHAGHSLADPGQRGIERGDLPRLAHRDELLELIDEQDQAVAARPVMQLAAQRLGLGGDPRGERRVLERRGQRGQRPAAGHQRQRAPRAAPAERPVDHGRHHPGAAQRRLADPGVAGHHHDGLGAQPLDDRADLEPAAEEHAAVRRLERPETAVRILVEPSARGADRGQPLDRLAQLLAAGEPLLRIAREAAGDQRRHPRLGVERRRIALADHVAELGEPDPGERRRAADQLEQHRADRVDIGSPRRRIAAPDLGGHVVGRAGHARRGVIDALAQHAREPEVDQLGDSLLGHHHVARLDVAVHHAAAMRRREPAPQVDRDRQRLRPRHRPRHVGQRRTSHQLAHDVRPVTQLADPINADHVGMLDPCRGPRLHQEPLPRGRLGCSTDELDRDRPRQHRVLGEVDLAGRALPEPAQDHVIVELLGRLESRGRAGGTRRHEILSATRHVQGMYRQLPENLEPQCSLPVRVAKIARRCVIMGVDPPTGPRGNAAVRWRVTDAHREA